VSQAVARRFWSVGREFQLLTRHGSNWRSSSVDFQSSRLRTSYFSREGKMLCTQKHMLGATGARKVRDKGELEIREN
jgi:hypothetical protein